MKRKCETGFEGKSTEKMIFPKWRLTAILAIAVLTIGTLGGCGKNGAEKVEEKINWSDMELGDRLPEPPSGKGRG